MKHMLNQSDAAHWLTFLALPSLLAVGWMVHISWMLGAAGSLVPILALLLLLAGIVFIIRGGVWKREDARWLIAPALVTILTIYLPWWSLINSSHTDAIYHLIQSNSYIGRIQFEPLQHGQDFLFRPPILPGIFAIELLVTGNQGFVNWTPLIILTSCLWQLQHLAERWTTPIRASIVLPVFLLIPVIRYWGQLAYLDVPVAGMWICTIHLLLQSETKPQEKRLALLLGAIAGATFLTKYVFVYLLGLAIWFVLKDRERTRAVNFLSGWIIVVGPFLLYHALTQGDPFAALSPQTSFAIGSATEVLGEHGSRSWWYQLIAELTIFGALGAVLGLTILWMNKRVEFIGVLVLLLPLLALHVFILDFGTSRYHTPWLALAVVLATVALPSINANENGNLRGNGQNKLPSLCIALLILVAASHLQTISEESEYAEEFIIYRGELMEFHLSVVQDVPSDAILLSGHDLPIILNIGIESYRFADYSDPIAGTIPEFEATHIATSNWGPRYQWEKDIDALLGHTSIEPISVTVKDRWTGILWEVNSTARLDPSLHITTDDGRVVGDVLILETGQNATIGTDGIDTVWIEVDASLASQNVLQTLLGNDGYMIDGCFYLEIQQGGCIMDSGDVVSADVDTVVYIWFVKVV